MKKILILFLFISVSIMVHSQSGSGTLTDPYYGSITTSVSWNLTGFPGGVIYIGKTGSPASTYNDLTVNTGGTLTISQGITVTFLLTTSDLIITGSGVITATGTTSSPVVFTKYSSISHWGHISFEIPGSATPITGTGSFNHCTIEYGYAATSGSNPSNAGGGIQVNATGVTITNCLFRNNYSNFGGGITVNAGRNTIIKNCIFKSNSANECGGAMLLWTSSTALVENCIFEQNYCKGTSAANYSGGAIWLLSSTSKIVNCTFVENTSDRAGDAIYSYSSSGSRIINSILWGSNDQFAGASTTSTIVTCAFETSKPANAANSIILSDVASDHFTDASSSDWSLRFVSPCRDAGTNSYTGVTIPLTDYIGNPRIYTKDIGAYEVQYSRWNGSSGTGWTEPLNWEEEVVPGSGSGDVVIPVVTSGNSYPDWTNITVGSGKYMIVDPNASVTVADLTNNGTLRLRSGSAGYANMIISNSNTNTGSEIAELYLTGGAGSAKAYNYHYISSPIANLNIDSITKYTVNLLEYRNNDVTTDMQQGWHYWDDYPSYADPFSILTLGRGYDVYHSAAGRTFNFKGTFNIADVNITLENVVSPIAAIHGRNLVGNPFTCSIDFDVVAEILPAGVSKAIVFTSGSLGYVYYLSPVGGPNPGVTNIIPPMQGFFMKTTVPSGTSFTLPASAVADYHTQSRYKKGGLSSDYPLVRLKLADVTQSDYALIWFSKDATTGDDNDFDAGKLAEDRLTIWTTTDGNDFAINGLPFPETVTEIPVGLNIDSTGTYNISPYTIQNLDDYDVVLVDKTLGTTVNLKTTGTYTFSSDAGKIAGRFVIKIGDVLTAVENPSASASPFNIYYSRGIVNIIPLNDIPSGTGNTVQIFDMTGRIIRQLDNIELNKGVPQQIQLDAPAGIYFVNISGGKLRFVKKFVIN